MHSTLIRAILASIGGATASITGITLSILNGTMIILELLAAFGAILFFVGSVNVVFGMASDEKDK